MLRLLATDGTRRRTIEVAIAIGNGIESNRESPEEAKEGGRTVGWTKASSSTRASSGESPVFSVRRDYKRRVRGAEQTDASLSGDERIHAYRLHEVQTHARNTPQVYYEVVAVGQDVLGSGRLEKDEAANRELFGEVSGSAEVESVDVRRVRRERKGD